MKITIQQLVQSLPDKRTVRALFAAFDNFLPNNTNIALTAHAGGTQAAGLLLNSKVAFHEVGTVASTGDSILLPKAEVGQVHFVKNSGAKSMQVYGSGTDTIESVATATGVAHGNGQSVVYVCLTAGNYIIFNGAPAGLRALTSTQVSALTTVGVASLSSSQLQALTTSQLSALCVNNDQIVTMLKGWGTAN